MKQVDKKPPVPVSRRVLLKTAALYGIISALPALGEDQPASQKPQLQLQKRSKESVKYQDIPYLGRSCAKCMLYTGEGRCALIEGTVSPDGWCNQWIPPTLGSLSAQRSERA
jgi:hypothetical protein